MSPKGDNRTHRLLIELRNQGDRVDLLTLHANRSIAKAIITLRRQHEHEYYLSSFSDCQISGLEVYRGSRRATEIDFKGLSITHEGLIEVVIQDHACIFITISKFFHQTVYFRLIRTVLFTM